MLRSPRGPRYRVRLGIAHGFATLGTIGFEGRFDYAAIGTVFDVASRHEGSGRSDRRLLVSDCHVPESVRRAARPVMLWT
jgi:class 3 adenylate cyclase